MGLPRSHPSRGGWIEIFPQERWHLVRYCPTPHGVGGLKSVAALIEYARHRSHPSRGGWIEISTVNPYLRQRSASHPSRGGWIEMPILSAEHCPTTSHPSRGGWIEIALIETPGLVDGSPTPHGVGGLKYFIRRLMCQHIMYHPKRGWRIEIG